MNIYRLIGLGLGMNIYRLIGDSCHYWSYLILLRRLILQKNAHGISVKTHVLYLIVFVTRYLDLFTTFYSLYNSFTKLFYISSTAFILGSIRYYEPLRSTCDTARDNKPALWKLVFPCFMFATVISFFGYHDSRKWIQGFSFYDVLEWLWTFSICLEPVAILPQLFLVFRYRNMETIQWIYQYILFKGIYMLFYIFNWIYRAHNDPHYRHPYLVYICGILQTLIYADFLRFYLTRTSLIRWMALRNQDVEYVDNDEEEHQGVQFELLLEDEDSGEDATSPKKKANQRGAPSKVKDGFITILEEPHLKTPT